MKKHVYKLVTFIILIISMPSLSCAQRSIYETIWKAEEYFSDPQQVALCKAIEKADLAEIDRLVQAGADVNVRGKDGMTPLLWSYPAGEDILERILKHGGDPNVHYNNSFKTPRIIEKGDTLLILAIKSTSPKNSKQVDKFKNYVDILLRYGADPNLEQNYFQISPLVVAVKYNNVHATELLIKAGADIDYQNDVGTSLLQLAARGDSYQTMLVLLKSGADYRVIDRSNGLIISQNLGFKYWLMEDNREVGKDYREVVSWLEKRGVSIERGKQQRDQWKNMQTPHDDSRAIIKRFIEEVSKPEVAKWLPPTPSTQDNSADDNDPMTNDSGQVETIAESKLSASSKSVVFFLLGILCCILIGAYIVFLKTRRKKNEKR